MSFSDAKTSTSNGPISLFLLTADCDYELWINQVTTEIRKKAQDAAAHMDSNIEPTFVYPDYETITLIARKPFTDQYLGRGIMTAYQEALPRETWDATRAGLDFNLADRFYYYNVDPNPIYMGTGGKTIFDTQVRAISSRQTNYENYQKAWAWSVLVQNCCELIMSQVKIPPQEFELKQSKLDYIWLREAIRFIHTGEGSHSVTLVAHKILTLRSNGNYIQYNTEFTRLILDIERRKMDKDKLWDMVINTAYHVGLRCEGENYYTRPLNELFTLTTTLHSHHGTYYKNGNLT